MVSFAGIRSNQLMGYGIVVGLDGTGDSSLAVTLQSMQSTISQFGFKSIYKSGSKNWCYCIINGKS